MRKTLYLLALCFFSTCTIPLHAQWVKTNGLPGGTVDGFLHYSDTVVATVGNELYFSSNHGEAWSPIANPFYSSINALSRDSHNVFGYAYDRAAQEVTWFRTDDFFQTVHPISIVDTLGLHDFFLAHGYVYASEYHNLHPKLYRTNNDGASWEYVAARSPNDVQFDGQRITGTSYPYILQSTDEGFTWDTLLQVSGNVMGMLQHENHLFAFMQKAEHGCYASNDYGHTWQQHTGLAFDQFHDFIWHNGIIYGLTSSKIYKSSNLGQSWLNFDYPLGYSSRCGISIGDALLIADDNSGPNSILRSTDEGATWSPSAHGIIASAGKLRSVDNTLYAPSIRGLYKLEPDGFNWANLQLGNPPPFGAGYAFDYAQSNGNWIVATNSTLRYSTDQGITWQESELDNWWWGWFIRLEIVGNRVIAVGYNGDFHQIFISDDHGLTFTPLNSAGQIPQQLESVEIHQEKIYALSSNRKIFRSDDGGIQWTLHTPQVPSDSLGSHYYTQLLVRDSVMAICALNSGETMLYSKDLGQSWVYTNLATAGLPFGNYAFNDLLYVGNYLVAANANGIFLSLNDGSDWGAWNIGLEARYITDIEVHDGYLWAAAEGSGIWKRPLSEMGINPVTGIVFFDENANAQHDVGEPGLSNVVVESLTSHAYANTRADGTYNLLSNLAQEEIKAHPKKPYWTLAPATQTVAVPSTGADFAVHFDPNAQDLSANLTNTSVLRPGFETNYLLAWRNNVPFASSNVVLTLSYPTDLLELLSSTPPPDAQSGSSLIWELGDVAALSTGTILLQFKVPTTVPLDAQICATVAISPFVGDLAPNDNTYECCGIVVGSFDPNDKQAEPSDFLTPAQLAANDPITYTIRFQNTGNYPAAFVRIADTLQQNFDPASFQFLSSSHPCTWSLRGQGEVEFFFSNIELPPITTDEPGSHGFVKYSVRPRQNLPLGTPLRNTAHIFFDFNAPVTTNTTETTAGLVHTTDLSNRSGQLLLSPNPASHLVRVETGGQAGELILQDATGRVVLRQSVGNSNAAFSVEGLPQGVYQVIFLGEKTMRQGSLAVLR